MVTNYQPNIFDKSIPFRCKDCEGRYWAIHNDYGSFKDKVLIDFYSANSYFGFKFLMDGGKLAWAIEKNEELNKEVNKVAVEKGLFLCCFTSIDNLTFFPDIALLLDSYGYSDTAKYMDIIKQQCGVSYISAPSEKMNEKVAKALEKDFKCVTPIYAGKSGQIIYRCQKS